MTLNPTSTKTAEPAEGATAGMTPTGTQSLTVLALRRFIFGILVIATIAWLGWWLATILVTDGFWVIDALMLVAFLSNAPWIAVGFWNSVFGVGLLHGLQNPLASVIPLVDRARSDDLIFERVAIFMTVRNEEAARAFARLRAIKASLDATGHGDSFDYFALSDSSLPDVISAEELAFKSWRAEVPDEGRIVYRRREVNTGFKAGNVRDFCERWGADYDIMVPLDADSLMTGKAILRLVRIMQANPRLGILQSLVVGMPSPSMFARIFQFGMRHAMRAFTTGSAWWHADCGPFWGHNAAVRVAPFTEYCRLPDLSGKPPLGGHVLSHDQIEAVLMRNAGYEVRVLPEEEGSYEEMPPALPDFAVRDLRWCQGNLQYLKLIHLPRLPTSRFNILFAIQMFIGVAGLVVFVALAAIEAVIWRSDTPFPTGSALALYVTWLIMYFTPKLAGLADAVLRSAKRYGGTARLLIGGVVETLFTFILVPISMVGQTLFMVALLFGRTMAWNAQRRDRYRLAWSEAFASLWPHTAFGLALLLLLALGAPRAIPWFLPFLAGLVLAVPFAVATASPELGALAAKWKLCAIPEEFETTPEIAAILPPAARAG
jgi:membrane glycosyltransferase